MVEGAAVAGEVLDKRTEFSRTLKNKDGSFTVQSFTGPIHFKDKKGDFQQVEGALVASDKPGYAVKNKAHRFGVNIKDQLGPEAIELVTEQGAYTISPEGLDKAKVALTDSPRATGPSKSVRKIASFKQAAPGTDVEYQVTPTGLKETIILAGPESPSTFTYLLKGPGGTKVSQLLDGSLLVETSKGKRAFSIDAPWAEEKAVLDQPQRTDSMLTPEGRHASMSSKAVKGGHLITVVVDKIWLSTASFPVIVDPTVTLIPGRNTIVTSGYPDSSYTGGGLISVGTSGTEVKRGLVGVDTSSIPVGSTVSAAWMYMRYDSCVSTGGPYACSIYSHQINAHRITGSWSEGNATWNWLDGQYDPGGPVGYPRAASEAVPNWNWWDLKGLVQQWVTGVYPNHGFMLKLADETLGRGGPCYLSRNTFYADQRPFMNVTYTLPEAPPGNPGSGPLGLEDFYPYSDFDLGQGTAFANMATGNLVVQDTDLDIPGNGLNMRLTRSYNSQADSSPGPFGPGWRLGVSEGDDSTLMSALGTLDLGGVVGVLLGNTKFEFTDADGTVHIFTRPVLGGWQSPPGVNLMLQDWGGGYLLTRPDRVYYYLVPAGGGAFRINSMADAADNYLAFGYDAGGKLSTVTDTAGRTFTISYTANVISNIRFTGGGATLDTAYGYDAAGKLASVTKAAGTADAITTNYEYAGGAISKVTDARTNPTLFGISSGRINQITDRAGKPWNFAYGGAGCSPQSPATVAVCLTNPETDTSVWSSDAKNNLLSRRDEGDVSSAGAARTNTSNYVWQNNRLQSETDPAGNTKTYTYDPLGQIATSVSSGGGDASLTSTFTYAYGLRTLPGWANMTKAQTGDRAWNFVNDSYSGMVTKVTDPLGKPTDFTYYVLGRLKTVTDANNNTTTYGNTALTDGGYAATGQPGKIADATGAASLFAFDYLGRLKQTTDRNLKLWKNDYDLRGNLTRSEDPLAQVTTYCFDNNDNQTLVIPPKGASRVCTLDGADGISTRTTYDPRDMVAATITKPDGKIRRSTFVYYDDGQLKEINEPRSFSATDPTGSSGIVQKATYLRYPNNRVSAFVNEEGKQTDVLYTPHGLVEKVTDPAGDAGRHTTAYTYNRLGQVKSAQESGHAAGASMRYEYNLFGEVTRQTTPRNTVTTFSPDAMGRPLTITDPMGKVTINTYDNVGNLKVLKQPTGAGAFTTTNYFYTARNEIDYETDPADPAHFIDYVYDPEGRQSFRHDRRDNGATGLIERTTQQMFNDDGTLAERKATGAGLAEHRSVFGYDADGNTVSVNTYKDGSATPNVSELVAGYTSAGELKDWSEKLYPPTGGAAITKTGSHIYGQDGLQTSNTADGQTSTSTWFLDGNEKTFTPYGGFGSFTSSYYGNGALNQMTFPNAAKLAQRYNLADMATSRIFTSSTGAKLSAWESIVYDENNNRKSELATQAQPTGAAAVTPGTGAFDYDNLDRLTSFKHPFETTTAAYGLDDAGNVKTEPGNTFTFANNRLTDRSVSLTENYVYGYDNFGNQTTDTKKVLLQPDAVTTTGYNAASQTQAGHRPRRHLGRVQL